MKQRVQSSLEKLGKPSRTNPFPQILQDLDFNQRLVMEPLLISDYLDRNTLPGLMVSTLPNLTKRTLPKQAHDLVSIRQVIPLDHEIVPSLVIVPMVLRGIRKSGLEFFAV